MSDVPCVVEEGDKLCLIPLWQDSPHCVDIELSKELDDQKHDYVVECDKKITSCGKFMTSLDTETHDSLLNVCCEYKRRQQKIMINDLSLYDHYFKDKAMIFQAVVKIKGYWFIEFVGSH